MAFRWPSWRLYGSDIQQMTTAVIDLIRRIINSVIAGNADRVSAILFDRSGIGDTFETTIDTADISVPEM